MARYEVKPQEIYGFHWIVEGPDLAIRFVSQAEAEATAHVCGQAYQTGYEAAKRDIRRALGVK